MQVALTVWDGRISPLFDATRMLLLVHVQDGRIVSRRIEPFDCDSPFSRAARLNALGVDVLICGGVSTLFANLVEAHGIRMIPFSSGDAEAVLAAYLSGGIHRNEYRMPGCGTQKQAPPTPETIATQEKKSMKIAISSDSPSLDGNVEARFGRCPYFVFVLPDTMEFESIQNPNVSLGGGAGPQTAQLMAQNGVAVVLTGNCGPNAFRTFGAAGIQVITGVSGRVRDAVAQFKAGRFAQTDAPTVQSHFGMGGGMGGSMGGGRGMGRAMGGGSGAYRSARTVATGKMDKPVISPNTFDIVPSTHAEEIALLKETVKKLQNRLDAIEVKNDDVEDGIR